MVETIWEQDAHSIGCRKKKKKEHEPSTRNHWMVESSCELRQDVKLFMLIAQPHVEIIDHQPKTSNKTFIYIRRVGWNHGRAGCSCLCSWLQKRINHQPYTYRWLRPSESRMLSSGLQEKEPSTINHWMVESFCELSQDVHAHLLAAE
jgi:hypothetical protein